VGLGPTRRDVNSTGPNLCRATDLWITSVDAAGFCGFQPDPPVDNRWNVGG
jgi:hypothetical protein